MIEQLTSYPILTPKFEKKAGNNPQTPSRKPRRKKMTDKGQPWSSTSAPLPDVHIRLHGVTFHLNKECMVSRSGKLAALLETKKHIDLTSNSITHFPADARTFELTARFCYGQEPELSSETVIPLACAASYLEMNEDHSPDNLFNRAISFLTTRILPYWNETVRALRSAALVLPYAQHLGLVDACLKSISEMAHDDPTLLGDSKSTDDGTVTARTGIKRRLFTVEQFVEQLTSLTIPVYELAVSALRASGVPPEQVAQCVYRYAKMWVDPQIMAGGAGDGLPAEVSVYERSNQRAVIETVERLLPNKRGVLHVRCLSEMLRSAIFLQVSMRCRDGLEARIGKQLPEALVDDLCMPCYSYTVETKYDVKCVQRILVHFLNCSYSWNLAELEAVSALMEVFLAEVGGDDNLRKDVFVKLLEMLASMGSQIRRCQDGVYRAIDVFLDSHGHMTEAEREEMCKVLDCHRMSQEACEHAAQNERLPLRVVTQVLFVGQRRIRDAITEAAMSPGRSAEGDEEKMMVVGNGSCGDDDGEEERMKNMMKMDNRVMELEREYKRMRMDVEKVNKRGLWKGMKDLLGCKRVSHAASCYGVRNKKQKVHPSNGGP